MELLLIYGGLILFLLFSVGYIFNKINMPGLLGHIFLGLFLSMVTTEDYISIIDLVAQVGIVLLFFLIGLKFSLYHLTNILRKIWQAGILDLFLCFGISFLLAFSFGVDFVGALILGGVAYSTSSSITLKMIDETGRSRQPEAEFKLALLLFEDISAPFIISVLTALSVHGEVTTYTVFLVLFKTFIMTGVAIIIAHYGFSRLELFVKRYLESDFLPLLVIAVAFITAGIAVNLGLSKLLGAFLAGVMLSETSGGKEFREMIFPLKNILVPFFSLWYGISISIEPGLHYPILLAVLILWSFISKIIVGWYGGRIFGLTKKGSARSGFSLLQRGEFSIIAASLLDPNFIAFSGLYIILTIILGVLSFFKAPALGEKLLTLIDSKS